MALPPCHVMTQFYVHNDSISCHMYQRSADMFLGVPFNIASYALLLSIFGEILNLKPKRFIHSFGDAHIYKNSIDQVREQISRTPKPMPELVMPTINSIDDLKNFGIEEFTLKNQIELQKELSRLIRGNILMVDFSDVEDYEDYKPQKKKNKRIS